ncbi:protein mono-ADP-ribosyltransferase PARP12 [Pimephales promelas]|uniref:protein mono-ADP-ribosyltransferase PARP12 n=1 Tax=Pimephales promelas TaxID=90988 RepID=UPI001955A3FA|nr:protein mono-ADP-ribosyltransferase PARP12 [Pimephales promelas]KAG1953496.1 protein mono-ADP-ribosyltransferase PARP12 [Pimephales promelas]
MATGNHFEWQLFDGAQWDSIANDIVIEAHYCQPGANGITLYFNIGAVNIDFDQMTVSGPLRNLSIRRNTLLSPYQKQEVGWYYKDNHRWCEYGSQGFGGRASSIGSDFIEQQYNSNPSGSVQFTAGSMTYDVDFTAMTQTNLSTNMSRKVRRRPKFNAIVMGNSSNQNSSQILASPLANPTNSSSHYIWEFMGDEGIWTEYQKPGCSLDSAEIERLYQLNPQCQVSFTSRRFSYSLYFGGMYQVNDKYGTKRAVRRIQQTNSALSQARWQFKDMDGNWKDFNKGGSRGHCSVSSQDIEAQYQQDSTGTMSFRTGRFNYELDFSDMTQTNQSTNTRRPVRRLQQ